MNKNNLLLIFFLLLVLFGNSRCASESVKEINDADIKASIEIPDIFKNDSIISAHLFKLSFNLEKFVLIMDELADEIEAVGIKKGENPSFRQRFKLMNIVLPKTQPVMELVKNISDLEKVSQTIKDTLPEEKRIVFDTFNESYNNRFDSLYQRFNNMVEAKTTP
ncbi:MAG: hypothetical protein PHT69_02945 [Bacteroidales bacterium]|nr:hypothetical protein [Bacteroidales bacterium]